MTLTSKQRRYLKAQAHPLEPMVFIGKEGVTPAVLESAKNVFKHHELIKAKFTAHKTEKKELAPLLATGTDSVLVDILGHIALLYRPHPELPVLKLPSAM